MNVNFSPQRFNLQTLYEEMYPHLQQSTFYPAQLRFMGQPVVVTIDHIQYVLSKQSLYLEFDHFTEEFTILGSASHTKEDLEAIWQSIPVDDRGCTAQFFEETDELGNKKFRLIPTFAFVPREGSLLPLGESPWKPTNL